MFKIEERRLALKALWLMDRGEFLEEYRRVVGEGAGRSGPISMASMIDRIIERETSESRLGG
jgi:hypothetical protein